MTAHADGAQRVSDTAALTITVGLLVAILLAPAPHWRLAAHPGDDSHAIELVLAAPELQPVEPPAPPRPPPRHREALKTQPVATQAPPPVDPIASTDEPLPQDAALVASSAPAAEAPVRSSANADLEAEYAAALREAIEQRAHSAEFARDHPRRSSGEVQVRFLVTRAGEPRAVAVLRSSGSTALDQAALAVVSSGHYAPMPPVIFSNESEHLFAVTIEFRGR
jgi:periplasmic protein TonB